MLFLNRSCSRSLKIYYSVLPDLDLIAVSVFDLFVLNEVVDLLSKFGHFSDLIFMVYDRREYPEGCFEITEPISKSAYPYYVPDFLKAMRSSAKTMDLLISEPLR